MKEGPTEDEAAARAAYEQLKLAIAKAVKTAEEVVDPDQAFIAAKRLVEVLRAGTSTSGALHARAAARIRSTFQLSYAALGLRLGIGKARAEQLDKLAARASKQGSS
jgi:hypothetical protein